MTRRPTKAISWAAPALGATSFTDFLILAQSVAGLEQGVLLNFGSAGIGSATHFAAA